jgi:hypothetical protein
MMLLIGIVIGAVGFRLLQLAFWAYCKRQELKHRREEEALKRRWQKFLEHVDKLTKERERRKHDLHDQAVPS